MSSPMSMDEELPEGWTKHFSNSWKRMVAETEMKEKMMIQMNFEMIMWTAPDKEHSQRHYYFNSKTGKQSWEHPNKMGVGSDSETTPKFDTSEGEELECRQGPLLILTAVKHPRQSIGNQQMLAPGEMSQEDTPEIAVLRDKQVKSLLSTVRQEDPLIPSNAGVDSCLHRELLKAGMDPSESESTCKQLSEAATEAAKDEVDTQVKLIRSAVTEKELQNRQIQIMWRDTMLVINRDHYLKVKRMYDEQGNDPQLFLVRLFCLLQRYESIGGAGYQNFGVAHECFASPLNSTLPSFGSAFFDTDMFFGSRGSFFDINRWTDRGRLDFFKGGSFEANPPFVEESMQLMSETIEVVLQKTEEHSLPASFIVIVPAWTDERAHEIMRESRFCQKLIVLEKSQHSYRSGTQHNSIQQYHDAGFRTSIFFLQNTQGAQKWPGEEVEV
ncbi:hypothetical protein GUITHDRAFT_135823 [Guillardia theta CCMP2712]|uniref:WW domain-containing protein n=1 Tax=Guillardia theta (strain CCMP2712) TaxID=905079 RepID=L1JMY6_GUITC|nr:hypothetical protein GUITHDRAFT_135823 [Guillardia theta CCMP2712]EKX49644.1 hypothetical protein GUITHDRAFT_135823 [Guillardia theta CCMP2712]|eukprot:XP_005836624.1 hypothetical protein GUITHDRAFT_135823 [Guillardia theta CCMP2712]